jgi:RHS repeat-associated protein
VRKNGTLYWLGTDHLGSTIRTAAAVWAAVDQQRYAPFGASRDAGTDLPTDERFTGQTEDAAIGLYWYASRAYDPALGRFTAPDTIVPSPTDPQTLNRFAYARNNPLRLVDPTGHAAADGTSLWDQDEETQQLIAGVWGDAASDQWDAEQNAYLASLACGGGAAGGDGAAGDGVAPAALPGDPHEARMVAQSPETWYDGYVQMGRAVVYFVDTLDLQHPTDADQAGATMAALATLGDIMAEELHGTAAAGLKAGGQVAGDLGELVGRPFDYAADFVDEVRHGGSLPQAPAVAAAAAAAGAAGGAFVKGNTSNPIAKTVGPLALLGFAAHGAAVWFGWYRSWANSDSALGRANLAAPWLLLALGAFPLARLASYAVGREYLDLLELAAVGCLALGASAAVWRRPRWALPPWDRQRLAGGPPKRRGRRRGRRAERPE